MNPPDLQTIMDRHNLLQVDLAIICSVTPRTVHNWIHGRKPVPRAVALLLRALDDGRIDVHWLAVRTADRTAEKVSD